MAENEGMEGKDFAKEEKIKEQFEKVIMQIINEMENDNATITIEGTDINIDVKKEKEAYQISLFGKQIATVREDEEFSYNIEELENIKKTLEDGKRPVAKYEDLGLPDIEYLKELEKEKEEKEKGEEDKNTDDEKEEKEEDEEKPDLEDDKEDREEIAEEYNVSSKDVIHIKRDDSDKVTEHENFASAAKFDKKYEDVYIIKAKDAYSWKAIGKDNEGKKEEIKNEQEKQTGGKNPDITIKKVSGEKIEEIKPLAVYKIDSQTAYAVTRNKHGETELVYCRQQAGDQKQYWGIMVPEAEGKNTIQESADAREFLDRRINSSQDLSDKAEAFKKADDLDKRGVPSKEKGVQTYEIEGNERQNREVTKEEIKEDLYERLGIKEKMKGAMPGYLDYIDDKIDELAEKILKLLEENDSISYEEAVEIVQKSFERDQGGRTPDQGPRKRAE
jgi:hypothetical protein